MTTKTEEIKALLAEVKARADQLEGAEFLPNEAYYVLLDKSQADVPRLVRAIEGLLSAVQYAEIRTNPDTFYNGHEHGYIRSTRLRKVVVDALAQVAKELKP